MELGAGIGRFTAELAKDAGQVIAVDFIDSVIKKNGRTNGHFKNASFMCADVTSPNMQIQPKSVDLIFSNWLLMYLSDKEVENLVERMMKWLKICWLWQKDKSINDRGFQRFLDNVQYKCSGILRYDRVFGEGYVSTGGLGTTKEFVAKLELKPSQKVLDVGCGIGGGDFYMAENFDVEVVVDCTKKSYPDNAFDVISSRDTILHTQDKPALFRTFYKWLKLGGKVLISDYCKRAGIPSPEFLQYIKQRGYDLHNIEAYGQMLKDAGFKEVIAEDRTDQFLNVLQRELDAVKKDKDAFIKEFSENDYSEIVNGWKAKLKRSSVGEQRWGLFIAKK
ncbi:hypothetical protein AAC387_Pa01g2047 [Persea americana]